MKNYKELQAEFEALCAKYQEQQRRFTADPELWERITNFWNAI